MPNTLAHFGVNGLMRFVSPKINLIWIYVGCLIPDFPWILQRAFPYVSTQVDDFSLRAYCIIQASFLFCLLASAIISLIARSALQTFVILSLSSFLHLLLDAAQTKWANGVHFFVPFDWHLINFGLFWPESTLTIVMTLWGGAFVLLFWVSTVKRGVPFKPLGLKRSLLLSCLILIYLVSPLYLIDKPIEANNHYLGTLKAKDNRFGKPIALDRVRYVPRGNVGEVGALNGEIFLVTNIAGLDSPATVSIKGVFRSEKNIEIIDYHIHEGFQRDLASIVGIILLILIFLNSVVAQFKLNKSKN